MRRQGLLSIFSRAGQIVAIVILATWSIVTIIMAVSDASGIAENNPGDFWRSYFIHIMNNLAR